MNICRDTPVDLGRHSNLDRRELQLWWLALIIIFLMALALVVIDTTNADGRWWFVPQLEIALNTRLMRASLLLATFVICAYFRDSARRLRRENSELICNLANYGKQLEKKNHEISRLKDLSDQLIGMTDIHRALDLVLGMAAEVIGADIASIMLREKNGDTLKIYASRGLSPEIVESTRIRMGEAIAGIVAKTGKGIILNSDELGGEMARRAHRLESIVSSVVVPIHVNDDVRGVVSIAKRRGGDCFSEEDMRVLSTLANQASLVIQRTDLLADLKSQVEILAATVEELRQAQAELMQSEKLASIGRLSGGVAHEINNPLQVILGRVEMLQYQQNDDTTAKHLSVVHEHTVRIADIVSNLLSFSRRSSDVQFQPLDINMVLNKTLELLEPQMAPDDISVVRDFEEGISPVLGSFGQLQQVFTNLVLNAYQAMREAGSGTITIRSRSKHDAVEVEVEDTGPGVPEESIDRLFEPFFTTKAEGEGTGLGLSIVYGIIQAHGGSIQAYNVQGSGVCFTVTLPAGQTPEDGGGQEGQSTRRSSNRRPRKQSGQ